MLRVKRLDLEDDIRVSQPKVLRPGYCSLWRWRQRLASLPPAYTLLPISNVGQGIARSAKHHAKGLYQIDAL